MKKNKLNKSNRIHQKFIYFNSIRPMKFFINITKKKCFFLLILKKVLESDSLASGIRGNENRVARQFTRICGQRRNSAAVTDLQWPWCHVDLLIINFETNWS
ncbi:hypothetical protein BpHYR1_001093 [Brachionus plicatilis]|uniref:Uncharacterized protein n=1 Tax=Brachionus plicatilis TaxID=10195 RepID=A0A3M7RI41_BRAPC|nr:hypothetical protein BpHYR1_001093 [Brachionus plicatilis]